MPWGARNAAASLARLPGVTFESENGDARYVIIRGIDPTYNAVSINGASLATGSPEDRATRLDGFELEGFDQIELTKVLKPDQPANAIGGLINFTSPSAFDYPAGHFEMGGDLILDIESRKLGSGAYLRHAQTVVDDMIGIFLTASTRQRSWENEATETDPFFSAPGGYLPQEEINFDQLEVERARIGGSLNWEQQLGKHGSWFVRGSHTAFDDTNWRQRSQLEFEDALASSSLTANGTEVRFDDDPTTALDDVGVAQLLRKRTTDNELSLWGVGGEFSRRHWKADFAVNRASAEEIENTTELSYELSTSPGSFRVDTPTYRPARLSGLLVSFADFGLDEVATELLNSTETNWNGHLNLIREFQDSSGLKRLKFGTHFQFKRKQSEVEVTEHFGGPTSLDSIIPSLDGPLLAVVPRHRISEFHAQRSSFNQQRDLGESIAGDYRSEEDIVAAFGMADWEWGTTNLTAGARWEQADFWSRSQSFDASNNTFSPVSGGRKTDYFLPGIHFSYRSPDTIHSTDAWSLRASYTQTLGRPGFEETKAGVLIEDDEIEIGNPNLKSLHAHNFDFGLSYENPAWGRFEATAFHKTIDDFIYANRRNFDFDGDGEIDEVHEFINGSSGAITGVELSYQHSLWGKPHSDRRLDLVTSTTFADSEANYIDAIRPDPRRQLPFVKQSDRIFQISLEWYHRAWMARASYHYRSGYLDEIGEGGDDFEVDAYGQLDISLGYQVSAEWSAYLRIDNLTAEPFRGVWATSRRIAESEELNPIASFGFTWKH